MQQARRMYSVLAHHESQTGGVMRMGRLVTVSGHSWLRNLALSWNS